MAYSSEEIRQTVEAQRAFFRSGATLDTIESREHPYNERRILPILRLMEK